MLFLEGKPKRKWASNIETDCNAREETQHAEEKHEEVGWRGVCLSSKRLGIGHR
jgi:hypothetical protein